MLVTVNRVVIPEYEITNESAHVDARGVDGRMQEAARQLVIRELLRQRAEEIGLDTEEDLEGVLDELMETEVQIPEIDESECRRYFEANRERLRTPETVEARHILLAAAPDDLEGRGNAEDRATALLEELSHDPSRFAALAAQHSDCPSASEGGHLGAIERGQTVPEFENVVLRLDVGLAARPVETRYGFHIVEVLWRQGGEQQDYEDVKHLIAEYIRERSWRRAVSQYIGRLAADAEIQGVDIAGDGSPLVQ